MSYFIFIFAPLCSFCNSFASKKSLFSSNSFNIAATIRCCCCCDRKFTALLRIPFPTESLRRWWYIVINHTKSDPAQCLRSPLSFWTLYSSAQRYTSSNRPVVTALAVLLSPGSVLAGILFQPTSPQSEDEGGHVDKATRSGVAIIRDPRWCYSTWSAWSKRLIAEETSMLAIPRIEARRWWMWVSSPSCGFQS